MVVVVVVQHKVSLLSIDLVVAIVLFIFMLVHCCVFCRYTVSRRRKIYINRSNGVRGLQSADV